MTADHPTREERYAAARDAAALYDETHAEVQAAPIGSTVRRLHSALGDLAHAALVAADPAPTQPDAGLSDDEREQIDAPIYDGDLDMHQRSDAVTEVIERILAARAAQPVPVPERKDMAWDNLPAPEVSRGVAEVKAEALHPAQVGICAADHRPFIALVEANALDDVDRRLTARIGEGRDDPETAREGSYFAGFLDGLESARAEVRWKRPDPPDRIVRGAHPADDGADCCRERTTAGGCGCGGGS